MGLKAFIPAVIVFVAQWPLLRPFFADLGSRPHYAFYPLVLLGAGWLFLDRLGDRPSASSRGGSRTIVALLLFTALVTYALGSLFYVRMFGAIAAGLTLSTIVWRLGGFALARAMLPVGVLLLTILPPPGRMDGSLMRSLQALAVDASSRSLDVLHIPHVVAGTVIDIPGHSLLVEEACSGINSLMAVVAFSLLYGFLARRNVARLAALLAMAVFFVLWVNIVRIVFGAVMLAWFNINLLDPAVHELTSVVLWAAALGLVLSADQLIGFVAQSVVEVLPLPIRSALAARGLALTRAFSFAPGDRREFETADPPHLTRQLAQPGKLWWGFAAAFLVVGVFSYVRVKDCWQPSRLDGASVFSPPAQIAGWQLQTAANTTSRRLQSVGRYQNHWVYRRDKQVAEVSFAYPFSQGYHDATECYIYAGWRVQSRETVSPGTGDGIASASLDGATINASSMTGDESHCFAAELAGPVDARAHLLFAAFAEDGSWLSPPAEPRATSWIARSFQLSRGAARRKPSCEVQTLCVFDGSVTSYPAGNRAALTELFHGIRQALRQQTVAQLEKQ